MPHKVGKGKFCLFRINFQHEHQSISQNDRKQTQAVREIVQQHVAGEFFFWGLLEIKSCMILIPGQRIALYESVKTVNTIYYYMDLDLG